MRFAWCTRLQMYERLCMGGCLHKRERKRERGGGEGGEYSIIKQTF